MPRKVTVEQESRRTTVYGIGDIAKYLVIVPIFTHAQLDALAELGAELKDNHYLQVFQTWTKLGGRHTYVRSPDGEEYHIAANGNIHTLGVLNS